MVSPVLNYQETREQFMDKDKPFIFGHMLFGHRHQRYMAVKMLQFLKDFDTENQDDMIKLEKMWNFYRAFFKSHSQVEEEKIHPALAAIPEAKPIVDEVEAQHGNLEKALQSMHELVEVLVKVNEGARDAQRLELLQKMTIFARDYHEHTFLEESKSCRYMQAIPEKQQQEISTSIKQFFQAKTDGKWMILGTRDVCNIVPADKQGFDERMPWFVRNVVFPALSFDAGYTDYLSVFPVPTADYNPVFKQLIEAEAR